MSNAERYVTEGLAHAGFAVISGEVAFTLRPDLWSTGVDAGMQLARLRSGARHRVARYTVQFDGLNRPVEVLARSIDRLALRLEWVTGMAVVDIADLQAAIKTQPVQVVARQPTPQPGGDQFAGVTTAQPGRTCGECDHILMTGRCSAHAESGLEWPHPNTPRRCPAFKPLWDSYDGRTGQVLWPELAGVKPQPEKVSA